MNTSTDKKRLLQIKDLKTYYTFHGIERTFSIDAKIIEILQIRPGSMIRTETTMEEGAIKDYWGFGKENRIIDGEEYTYKTESTHVRAVDGANINLYENESISVIGETGCGKSTLLLSILNLPLPHISHRGGKINYYLPEREDPINLLTLSDNEMLSFRGSHIGYIPQLSKEALNPWLRIGFQTGEFLLDRLSWRQERIKERVLEFLGKVALPDPKQSVKKYVNQLSGGEAQRVCIAMALITDPRILLADEPVAFLDTIVQASIIDLLRVVKKDFNFSYIFASHNIGAAGQLADIMAVMYGGEIIEIRPTKKFFEEPLHPYSKGVLGSNPWYAIQKGQELYEIPGEIPKASSWPKGCKFHPRCSSAMEICKKEKPKRTKVDDSYVECFLFN